MSATNGSNARLDRIERLIEQGELRNQKAHARFEQAQTRLERSQTVLESNLKRWAALGVQEARAQRRRSAELDKKIGQLAAAQLITEEKMQELKTSLKQFLSAMLGPRNGH